MGKPGRKPETSDEEIMRAIALHPDAVVTAGEVSDAVGMTNQGVNKRLRDLANRGLVVRKQVGARAYVYWLTGEGKAQASEA